MASRHQKYNRAARTATAISASMTEQQAEKLLRLENIPQGPTRQRVKEAIVKAQNLAQLRRMVEKYDGEFDVDGLIESAESAEAYMMSAISASTRNSRLIARSIVTKLDKAIDDCESAINAASGVGDSEGVAVLKAVALQVKQARDKLDATIR